MDFKAGDVVTIKVRNPVWPMRKAYASYVHIPEFNTYTGTVILKHKAIKDGQIGLTTGEVLFDMRVIDIDRIVGTEAGDVPSVARTLSRVWEVTGSKGDVYTVTESHGVRSCTCPGFAHRGNCKHTKGDAP